MKKREILLEIICTLLFMLFLYAALTKALNVPKFQDNMQESSWLAPFASWLPYWLITVEIVTALCLVLPRFQQIGLYASAGLLLTFILYIAAILGFSKHIPCSCGGVIQQLGWKQHLYFNTFFLLISIIGVQLYRTKVHTKYLLQQQPVSGRHGTGEAENPNQSRHHH